MSNTSTTQQKQNTQELATRGSFALQCDILDPAQDGSRLSEDALMRAVIDCAEFAGFASLEPQAIAVITSEHGTAVVTRHRILLVVEKSQVDDVVKHLRSYCELVLAGHPVMVSVRSTQFIA